MTEDPKSRSQMRRLEHMEKEAKTEYECECDARFSGNDEEEWRARGCPSCICHIEIKCWVCGDKDMKKFFIGASGSSSEHVICGTCIKDVK